MEDLLQWKEEWICNEERKVLKAVEPISMGAGILP